jgi:hypothetical protein
MSQKWARPWFAVTFVLGVVELVITCVKAADNTGGHFHSAAARVFNVFWAVAAGATWVDRRLPDRAEA